MQLPDKIINVEYCLCITHLAVANESPEGRKKKQNNKKNHTFNKVPLKVSYYSL